MRLVFVSSTFKDMQFERDELKNRVTPRIDSFLASYGENVYFGDLRWGVNTSELDSEESSKKVLKICLDEIDNCKPYMIVFIGERYGWIPKKELIHEAKLIKGISNEEDDISVTNLEIEYGALLNPDLEGRVLFYFRNLDTSEMDDETKKIYEAESALHKDKLENLKRKILKLYPKYVKEYDAKYDKKSNTIINLSPVMEMIYNDLCSIFKRDLDAFNELPIYKRATLNSHTRLEKYYSNAYIRSDLDYSLGSRKKYLGYHKARYDEIPMMRCVFGDTGSGRKTYLATLYKKALDTSTSIVIPYVNGLDKNLIGKENFLKTIVGHIEENLGRNNKDNVDTRYLIKLLKELKKQGKDAIVFVLNITDELYEVIRELEALGNGELSQIDNIFFYVQDEESEPDKSSALPFALKSIATYIKPLEDTDKLGIINSILKNKHKELPKKIIDKIVKKEGSDNALYLSLIVERLLMLDHQDFDAISKLGDDMKAIEKYMSSIIDKSGNNIFEISKELLKELVERINPVMISMLLKMFTIDYRLDHDDTKRFFDYIGVPFNDIDYSLFLHSVPSLFLDSSLSSDFVLFKCEEIKNAAKELVKELKVKDISKEFIKFIEEYDFGSDFNRDAHLFPLYVEFNKVKKCAAHFLKVIDKFDMKFETDYEERMLDILVKMNQIFYKDHESFFIDVLKEVVDLLFKNKYLDYPRLVTYFYIPFSFYFPNKNDFVLMSEWAIDLLHYIYERRESNEGTLFLLVAGLETLLKYLVEAKAIDNIKDLIDLGEKEDAGILAKYEEIKDFVTDELYDWYYEKYNSLFDEGKMDFRFLQDNASKRFYMEFMNSTLNDDDLMEFLEDYHELINNQYITFVLNQDHIVEAIKGNRHLTKEDIEKDRGLSLISSFMYFLKEYYLYDTPIEESGAYYHEFSLLLSDYLENDFFFIKDKYGTNYGTFILSMITELVATYVHFTGIIKVDYVKNRSLLFFALKRYLAINPNSYDLLKQTMAILIGTISSDGKASPNDFEFIYPLANKAIFTNYDGVTYNYFLYLIAHYRHQLFNGENEIDDKMVSLVINYYMYSASKSENCYFRIELFIYKYLKEMDRLEKDDIYLEKVYSEFISLAFDITKEEFLDDFMTFKEVWEKVNEA